MLTLVKKRGGSIVPFDRTRIETALEKAYSATGIPIERSDLVDITDRVLNAIEMTHGEEDAIPTVEYIQDLVEQEISKKGDFLVAKAYIIYRHERAEAREEEQKQIVERLERHEISVKKRSGKMVPFNEAEIIKAVENVCEGFEKCVDMQDVVAKVRLNIYDGITTSEINKAMVMTLKTQIEHDPMFSFVSARFLINDIYKEVIGTDEFTGHFVQLHKKGFKESIKAGVDAKRIDPKLLNFDLEKLASAIDTKRDKLFQYMGVQILADRYFLRDAKQKILETPQYFWMRVAMGVALNETEAERDAVAINFYNTISQMLYVPSTPTLLHSGTVHPQMSSCFLTTVEDDLKHIFKCIGDNAQLAKWSGGVANDWTNIRGTNALVNTINTGSQGLIPFLKIVDATTASINRSGSRRAALCAYLETWHIDVEDFLDLRKNTGDDRRRTHDINTAHWIPDLFMKRVQEDGYWTLFSPEKVPDLHHIYGRAFENAYIEYEKKADRGEIALFKRVKAQDLWRRMIMMIYETGHPWFTFKDPCNIRSPQDHDGVIHSSNLCTEITLNTSAEETAVCNIGSLHISNHVKNGAIDYALLSDTIKTAMRMLDNVIDINFYPVVEGKTANTRHRPVGLGIMGMQDVFYKTNVNFDSEQAVELSDKLQEYISWHAIMASSLLAKEKGAYETFKGSKWDRNIFPVDTLGLLEQERGIPTGIKPTGSMDWEPVRASVREFGMRNSNTMAIAPTATIANISGCFPSIEPIYKNVYVKSNFSGEFTVPNEYLVTDLKKENLWNRSMLDKIKQEDGNLENIPEIPSWIKAKYKEAFQIDPYWVIMHAAYRGKWIDQSQSINLFMNTTSGKTIGETYLSAWRMGLKTTYYLRSLGATSIEKSTVELSKANEEKRKEDTATAPVTPKFNVHVFKDESCESCQ